MAVALRLGMTRSSLRFGMTALLFVLVSGCSLDSFMFSPTTLSEYKFSDSLIPSTSVQMVELKSSGETIYGVYIKQPDSMRVIPHPTIIYHHGNNDNLEFFWPRIEYLYRCGFDVLAYDYQGFGKSTGTSTTEDDLFSDARAVLDYVRSRPDVDTTFIVHYGFSLGGVGALYSAAELHQAHAVILEAAYASGEALVQSGTLLNIPGGYLLEGEFNNKGRIGTINAPVLILHGTNDTFIPFSRHAQPLYDHARNPKTLIAVKGADHDNVPTTMGIQAYIDIITTFVRGN